MQATISPMFTDHPNISIPKWVHFLARPSVRWLSRPIARVLAAWKRARAQRYYDSIRAALDACQTYDEVVRLLGPPRYGCPSFYAEIGHEGMSWLHHESDPQTRRKFYAFSYKNGDIDSFAREFGQSCIEFFQEITDDLAARGLATVADCDACFQKKGCRFDVSLRDGRVLYIDRSDAISGWEILVN